MRLILKMYKSAHMYFASVAILKKRERKKKGISVHILLIYVAVQQFHIYFASVATFFQGSYEHSKLQSGVQAIIFL